MSKRINPEPVGKGVWRLRGRKNNKDRSKEIICPFRSRCDIIHAHWQVSLAENGWKDTTCSNCGFTINDDIQVLWNTKYCPECGAKMDEKENKNE